VYAHGRVNACVRVSNIPQIDPKYNVILPDTQKP